MAMLAATGMATAVLAATGMAMQAEMETETAGVIPEPGPGA